MAVWATANTAAPSVADSPHTAIFIILFPSLHSWPRGAGGEASRPGCQKVRSTEQGGRGQITKHAGVRRGHNVQGQTKVTVQATFIGGRELKSLKLIHLLWQHHNLTLKHSFYFKEFFVFFVVMYHVTLFFFYVYVNHDSVKYTNKSYMQSRAIQKSLKGHK